MDRYAFDTMKNGYNRYQVEDYIQTQKLQMESLQKKLEKANLLKEELTREYQELETRYRDVSENLEVKESCGRNDTQGDEGSKYDRRYGTPQCRCHCKGILNDGAWNFDGGGPPWR